VTGPSPLRIRTLRLRDFRNVASAEWEPHPRFNVLWGDNAQGKSNVLEAIYAVGSLRSFRGAPPAELVRWGATDASVEAAVHEGSAEAGTDRSFEISISAQTRRLTVRVDSKRPDTASDWFGAIQMVLFHPGSVEVVRGGPEVRRRALDRLLYQLFPGYADDHRKYAKALRSRNRLLATGAGDAALDAWEAVMGPLAERIVTARSAATTPIAAAAVRAHSDLSGAQGTLEIGYRPGVEGHAVVFQSRWAQDRAADRAAERTRAGPHRDDVEITLDGKPARAAASQGQQRTIALALSLAEISVLEGLRHRTPILLLDDVSSELDPQRNEALFRALTDRGGQVVVTTTRKEYVRVEAHANQRKDFMISKGHIVLD